MPSACRPFPAPRTEMTWPARPQLGTIGHDINPVGSRRLIISGTCLPVRRHQKPREKLRAKAAVATAAGMDRAATISAVFSRTRYTFELLAARSHSAAGTRRLHVKFGAFRSLTIGVVSRPLTSKGERPRIGDYSGRSVLPEKNYLGRHHWCDAVPLPLRICVLTGRPSNSHCRCTAEVERRNRIAI